MQKKIKDKQFCPVCETQHVDHGLRCRNQVKKSVLLEQCTIPEWQEQDKNGREVIKPWKTISANGRTWKVFFRHKLKDDDGPLYGMMLPNERFICLDAALKHDKEELLDTLVHEFLHAAFASEEVADLPEEEHCRVSRTLAQLLEPFIKKGKLR